MSMFVAPSKLEAEVYALQRAKDRAALDGTGWLRLYRAVAERDEIKLAELLEEAERAFMKAVLAGEVHRDAHWSAWYVSYLVGRMS
jgi:hypothetical protein